MSADQDDDDDGFSIGTLAVVFLVMVILLGRSMVALWRWGRGSCQRKAKPKNA